MRGTAVVAVLVLLGALVPAAAGQGVPEAARDLDGATAYAVGAAGGLLPLAELPPLGARAAPPLAAAVLGATPGTRAQGEVLRPSGAGLAHWGSDAAAQGDQQQAAAAEDAATAWDAWAAWGGLQLGAVAAHLGLPGAPLPAAPRLDDAPRPFAVGSALLAGPRVTEWASTPVLEEASNLAPRLEVRARIASGAGLQGAWAWLSDGSSSTQRAMESLGDGWWRAVFEGPLAAGPRTLWFEALEQGASAGSAAPGAVGGAWPLGYGRSEDLAFEVQDRLAPRVALSGVPAYTNASALDLVLALTDDVGVDAMRAGVGGSLGEWEAPSESLRLALPGDGDHVVMVQARDLAGNIGEAEALVVRDSSGPDALLSLPGDGWRGGPADVAATAGPSLAPATLHVTTDGSDPRLAPAFAAGALRIEAAGATLVRAVAKDLAGNTGEEARGEVRIDPHPPVVALQHGLPEAALDGWLAGAPVFTVVASDALSGLAEVRAWTQAPGSPAVPADPAGFPAPEGEALVRAEARDAAGNTASAERVVRVDLTPPTLFVRPTPAPDGFTLTWRAQDAASGVAEVALEAREPGGAWRALARGGATGEVRLEVPQGEAREVRATAVDRVGHAAPEATLRVERPAAPATPVAPSGQVGAGDAPSGASSQDALAPADAPDAPDAPDTGAPAAEAPASPRLVQETLAGGAVRVSLQGGQGATLLRVQGPDGWSPWRIADEVVLDEPGEHRVEVLAGGKVLHMVVQVAPREARADAAPAPAADEVAPDPAPGAPRPFIGPPAPTGAEGKVPEGPRGVFPVPAAGAVAGLAALVLAALALARRRR